MAHIPTPTTRSERRFGHFVAAPSAANRSEAVWFGVDPVGTVRRIIESGLLDRYAEYEGLVHGDVDGGTGGLMLAHALFKGIRPGQEHIYSYVLDPIWTYTYPIPHRFGLDGPTRRAAYADSVFVVYADNGDEARRRSAEMAAQDGFPRDPVGLVYNWEWMLRSAEDTSLPDDFQGRYIERVWQ